MRLMLGDYGITIAMKDAFGKRPGLYVENRNCSLKVGNFASEEKARHVLAFECARIDRGEGYAAAGYKLFAPTALSLNVINVVGEHFNDFVLPFLSSLVPSFVSR